MLRPVLLYSGHTQNTCFRGVSSSERNTDPVEYKQMLRNNLCGTTIRESSNLFGNCYVYPIYFHTEEWFDVIIAAMM